MGCTFLLRNTGSKKPVSISMRILRDGSDDWYTLPVSILPARWDKRNHCPKAGRTETEYEESVRIAALLKKIEFSVNDFMNRCEAVGRAYSKDDVRLLISRVVEGDDAPDVGLSKVPCDILPYINFLIESMKSGTLLFSSQRYTASTIKTWVVFRNVYRSFSEFYELGKGRLITWDSIDKTVYDAFVGYCRDYGYMVSTINKMVISFKAAISYAHTYHGLHDNMDCIRFFSLLKVSEGEMQTKIYLTDEEIQALYEMPLPAGSLDDRVRDVFLLGCYTGQRVSDYARLSGENFTVTPRGTPVVKLRQVKTGNTVVVPILNDNLVAIAQKYDYELPDVSDVIINRYIKKICKKLSESVPSLAERVPTVLTLRDARLEAESLRKGKGLVFERNRYGRVVRPRYELVCTHTARRSMITNLYKTRRFSTLQIMSISGHKTERHFWLYMSESSNEIADEIAEIQREAEKDRGSNIGLF